jgi:hypothetical protein
MKKYLKPVIDNFGDYEDVSTLLCIIEAQMNSRPLCPVRAGVPSAITPQHFSNGKSIHQVYRAGTQTPIGDRWKKFEKAMNEVWSIYNTYYIECLQKRTRWNKRIVRNYKPGDVVVLKEDDTKPTQWHLGTITKTCPGKDGLVRVVKVRTLDTRSKKGIKYHEVDRSIEKIALLPVSQKLSNEYGYVTELDRDEEDEMFDNVVTQGETSLRKNSIEGATERDKRSVKILGTDHPENKKRKYDTSKAMHPKKGTISERGKGNTVEPITKKRPRTELTQKSDGGETNTPKSLFLSLQVNRKRKEEQNFRLQQYFDSIQKDRVTVTPDRAITPDYIH